MPWFDKTSKLLPGLVETGGPVNAVIKKGGLGKILGPLGILFGVQQGMDILDRLRGKSKEQIETELQKLLVETELKDAPGKAAAQRKVSEGLLRGMEEERAMAKNVAAGQMFTEAQAMPAKMTADQIESDRATQTEAQQKIASLRAASAYEQQMNPLAALGVL